MIGFTSILAGQINSRAGGGSNTSPQVEVYRGEIGAKMPFLPQKRAGLAPKIARPPRGDLGANLGRVIVSTLSCRTLVWPRPAPARGSLSPLYYCVSESNYFVVTFKFLSQIFHVTLTKKLAVTKIGGQNTVTTEITE
jgi:hypothetical protein